MGTSSKDLTAPLKPLRKLTKAQWMRLSQREQLELYNVCVDNCDELFERMCKVADLIREQRENPSGE